MAATSRTGLIRHTILTRNLAAALIPRYTQNNCHKGAHGKTVIVGGSFEYTGAPFYSGLSALKAGCDLAWVVCTADASGPIKSYSPELIVLPLLPSAKTPGVGENWLETSDGGKSVLDLIGRAHSVVIGPGLGRDPLTLSFVRALLPYLVLLDVPTVLDGDALWLLASNRESRESVYGAANVVLTPNAMERRRLAEALGIALNVSLPDSAHTLSAALGGIAVLAKGAIDAIAAGPFEALPCDASSQSLSVEGSARPHHERAGPSAHALAGVGVSSPRRCGGQGDVLAGLLGAHLAWARSSGVWAASSSAVSASSASNDTRKICEGTGEREGEDWAFPATVWEQPERWGKRGVGRPPPPTRPALLAAASYGASLYTRIAARASFEVHGRASTTPDILGCIGAAIESGSGSSSPSSATEGVGLTPEEYRSYAAIGIPGVPA